MGPSELVEPGSTTASSGTPEPALVEALFEDIAVVTGMPFPNLVHRRLAEDPERLRDCWHRVRTGLVMVGARRLRRLVLPPAAPLQGRRKEPALSAGQRDSLLTVLDAYDAGNACNAVVVRLLLDGTPGNARAPIPASASSVQTVTTELPVAVGLAAMSPHAREQTMRLARAVNPTSDIVPTLFRHLGHDGELLETLADTVEQADREGVLHETSRGVQGAVAATLTAWPQAVTRVSDPAVRAVLAPFADAIPRTLAVSAVLRAVHGGSSSRVGTSRA